MSDRRPGWIDLMARGIVALSQLDHLMNPANTRAPAWVIAIGFGGWAFIFAAGLVQRWGQR